MFKTLLTAIAVTTTVLCSAQFTFTASTGTSTHNASGLPTINIAIGYKYKDPVAFKQVHAYTEFGLKAQYQHRNVSYLAVGLGSDPTHKIWLQAFADWPTMATCHSRIEK